MTTISKPKKAVKLFYCYAREDKALRDQLDKHLSSLKRKGQIITWYDREISPGVEWEREIDTHLKTSHIILLLVSPNFMASDYCYSTEMKQALKRHKSGTVRVIPIILQPVDWKDAPFSKLQALPADALPITRWPDQDVAFLDIVNSIHKAVREIQQFLKTKEEWRDEGNVHYDNKRYEEALAAYEQAIHLDPNYAVAYNNKGTVLDALEGCEEALAAYEQAIHLDPNYVDAYSNKGDALNGLKRYEEALVALEQAIHLDPNYVDAYSNKGFALSELKRYEEALVALEQAIHLNPNYSVAYNNRGFALSELNRYEEALVAYDQAIHLDPNYADAYR